MTEEWERWNTHFSTIITQEIFGIQIQLHQDPNSNDLGTTVWDASIVFAKYLQKNINKDIISKKKLNKSRVIELGAGMGLSGIAFALLGCKEIIFTDKASVLPLLTKNTNTNLSKSSLKGTIYEDLELNYKVCELDWTVEEHLENFNKPFDFVLATDCVYHENHIKEFYDTIVKISDKKSTIFIVNEKRSESVDEVFFDVFKENFKMKKVTMDDMDPVYRHESIQIYILKRK